MADQQSAGLMSVFILSVLLPYLSASPLLSSFLYDTDSEVVCGEPWNTFGSLCWITVPQSLTLYDEKQADLYCSGRGARVLHIATHHFCVKDPDRQTEDNTVQNVFGSQRSAVNKRIMGNVGF